MKTNVTMCLQLTKRDNMIDISKIRIDGGTQPRQNINETVIQEYADSILEGATLPPVDIFFDSTNYWLADGFHRYCA